MKRLALTASLAVLVAGPLGGCGGGSPAPPDSYYRLHVVSAEEPRSRPALPGVLSISAFDGDGLVRSRPLLYTKDADGEAVLQHNYHHWADSPTRLVQDQLAAFLKDAAIAQSVVTPELRVRADYEVIGRIQRLERIIGGPGGPRVAAAIELAVVRQSDRKLIHARSYSTELRQSDDSVVASVAALNAALEQIFKDFAVDLSGSEQTSRR